MRLLTALCAALLLTGSAQAAPLTATWQDNSGNEQGFILEGHCGDGTFAEVGRVEADVTTFTFAQPEDPAKVENTCTYRVLAYNAAGQSAPSNEVSVSVPTAVPASPSGLLIEALQALGEAVRKIAQALLALKG